jgi:DNA-binding response OmpR family regulator
MKKIFILDDNEELLDILNRLLGKEYQLKLKSDSQGVAVEIFEFEPDLIILDHTIGEVSSTDVIKELRQRKNPFPTPVILFSAHLHIGEVASNIGAQGYIEKPSDINFIRNYIKSLLPDPVT